MNKYLFVPDLVKFDQSFAIEAENIDLAMKKANEELCCNVDCSCFQILPYELLCLGKAEFFEGEYKFFSVKEL